MVALNAIKDMASFVVNTDHSAKIVMTNVLRTAKNVQTAIFVLNVNTDTTVTSVLRVVQSGVLVGIATKKTAAA